MRYISTRDNYQSVESSAAIRLGMVPEGGLFVPESFPQVELSQLQDMSYHELAVAIMKDYLTDFTAQELAEYVGKAYSKAHFESSDVVPLHFLDEKSAVLELWHGPTAAFKDLALQVLPYLLTASAHKQQSDKKIVILVATSGDTGKAALEGFRDIPDTEIIVFYPKDGVSHIQEAQMATTGGSNTHVVGVRGNFDDCQTMVKEIFGDVAYKEALSAGGYEFSSANSINWGRLVPQIVYYFWSYFSMVKRGSLKLGDAFNVVVPTGNFGNILAAYYASMMGLPVKKFICASNKNKVLTDFFEEGHYNRNREFYRTASPSMDILISSNLERFLFAVSGQDGSFINDCYAQLEERGSFEIGDALRDKIGQFFYADYADEEAALAEIKKVYDEYGYLIDTHTAVAMRVYRDYCEKTGDQTATIIDSTASPYKFNSAVYESLTGTEAKDDEFVLLDKMSSLTGTTVHRSLAGLDKLEVKHDRVMDISEGRAIIKELLNIS